MEWQNIDESAVCGHFPPLRAPASQDEQAVRWRNDERSKTRAYNISRTQQHEWGKEHTECEGLDEGRLALLLDRQQVRLRLLLQVHRDHAPQVRPRPRPPPSPVSPSPGPSAAAATLRRRERAVSSASTPTPPRPRWPHHQPPQPPSLPPPPWSTNAARVGRRVVVAMASGTATRAGRPISNDPSRASVCNSCRVHQRRGCTLCL
ncbi:hypothetical protein PVAP13_3NG183296 [Panicum virgatum]|uniref:Uncharacterized protein n=1 Tax=Panicum virgatum TaxID=38727 RepID=A0A8T0U6S9_PANVG|nr:hypothetical protein PVAP13_3NG183296 [Panicum virgatum]